MPCPQADALERDLEETKEEVEGLTGELESARVGGLEAETKIDELEVRFLGPW